MATKKIKLEWDGDELIIRNVEVSHPSKVNANFRTYPNARQKVKTFVKPYNKKVLLWHNDMVDPVGYVENAYYRKQSINDPETDAVVVDIRLVDKNFIEKFLKGVYNTFSIGAVSEKSVCSICGEENCDHVPGQVYDGNLCYRKTYLDKYVELSFVTVPADENAFIPIEEVRNYMISSNEIGDDIDSDRIIIDTINIEIDKMGGNEVENKDVKIDEIAKELGLTPEFIEFAIGVLEMSMDDLKEIVQKVDSGDTDDLFDPELLDADSDDEGDESDEGDEGGDDEGDGDGDEKDSDGGASDTKDKKLPPVGSKARQKMKGPFCGPDKTFPVPDCKHAAVAMAMLNWPAVKKKYSAAQRKKIAACIMRVAKRLGCPMAKKKKKGDDLEKKQNQNQKPEKKEISLDALKKLHPEFIAFAMDVLDDNMLIELNTIAERALEGALTLDDIWDENFDAPIFEKAVEEVEFGKSEEDGASIYCGPNKTFPIPDCQHAAIALAMLKWPKLQKDFRGHIGKIRESIYRKARMFGCDFAQSENDKVNDDNDADIKKDENTVVVPLEKFEQMLLDLKEKDLKIKALEEEIERLKGGLTDKAIEVIKDIFKTVAPKFDISDMTVDNYEDYIKKYKKYVADEILRYIETDGDEGKEDISDDNDEHKDILDIVDELDENGDDISKKILDILDK